MATDYASADYVGIAGMGPDDGAPSTPGGTYAPHIFRDMSVNRGDHEHKHSHDQGHDHEGKTVAPPPLTPPEDRDLVSDADVKVHFLD